MASGNIIGKSLSGFRSAKTELAPNSLLFFSSLFDCRTMLKKNSWKLLAQRLRRCLSVALSQVPPSTKALGLCKLSFHFKWMEALQISHAQWIASFVNTVFKYVHKLKSGNTVLKSIGFQRTVLQSLNWCTVWGQCNCFCTMFGFF